MVTSHVVFLIATVTLGSRHFAAASGPVTYCSGIEIITVVTYIFEYN